MTGILLLNFGEPEHASVDDVERFLEAIFVTNFRLEHAGDPEAGRRRAEELARRRAPSLVEEYRRMGGSPLRRQTDEQARALEVALRQRGEAVRVAVGMQFTSPRIPDAVGELRAARVDRVIALPLYPLCGPSTTIFALDEVRRAIGRASWDVEVVEVTGWHRHREYTALRARAVRSWCERERIDLEDSGTRLVFSAHGTPLRYLREGNRYDLYVRDHCDRVAARLGIERYELGFQNHEHRPGVEWTLPALSDVLYGIRADRVVVVPVSFMHEQSETLVELDVDVRELAESAGLGYSRVPIPYDDPAFVSVLADVVVDAASSPAACRCRPGAHCSNDGLEY